MKLNNTIITLMLSCILTLPMIGCGNNAEQQTQEPIQQNQVQEQIKDKQNQEIINDFAYYDSVASEVSEILNIASDNYTEEVLYETYMWCESKMIEVRNYDCNSKTMVARNQLADAISALQSLISACELEVKHNVSVPDYHSDRIIKALQKYSDTCDGIIDQMD